MNENYNTCAGRDAQYLDKYREQLLIRALLFPIWYKGQWCDR